PIKSQEDKKEATTYIFNILIFKDIKLCKAKMT
ncbi:hypothetical protein HMPREF9715_02237, partial [Myroides odoratimimus CIP 101113]